MTRWARLKLALDGKTEAERQMAKLTLRLDYPGQKRESNGQFGTGKKAGGSSASSSTPASKVTPNIQSLGAKAQKKAHEFSNSIASGKAKLRDDGMKAHMPNTREYVKHTAERKKMGQNPSYFTSDYNELAVEVKSALKSRNVEYTRLPSGEIRGKIDLGREIGITYDLDDQKGHGTSKVTVVLSEKNGDWHFYPSD